jgi:hypothetical protein
LGKVFQVLDTGLLGMFRITKLDGNRDIEQLLFRTKAP